MHKKFFMMSGNLPELYEFSPVALASGEEHCDYNNATWSTLRNATSGWLNSSCYFWAQLVTSTYYLGRAFLRFNFAASSSYTIASGKIVMIREGSYTMVSSGYVYLCTNDGTLADTDYDSFSTQLSNLGTIEDSDTQEFVLNSTGISEFQDALDAGGTITVMILHEKDHDNDPPTGAEDAHYFEYENCSVEFTT